MDEDLDTPEAKKYFMEFMTNPDRNYCEGRFLALGAELARMGYKHRIIAQAGLNVGLVQAAEESPEYHSGFMRGLGEMSQRAAARRAFEIEDAEKALAERT